LGSALGRFPDFTSRAAVYAIRTYGGKGGAPRKRRPYPNVPLFFCFFMLTMSAYSDILRLIDTLQGRRCMLQLMSIEDLAAYLGDSKRTIYKYIASGDSPPYIRLSSKNIKFDRADVDKWLESRKVNPNKPKERK
jgi:excisionase family DNA binding protein